MSPRFLPLALALSACAHELPDTPWRVDDARILGVKFEPPEAPTGTDVAVTALVASSQGTMSDAAVDWAVCRTPKPPAENRSVNQDCFGAGSEPAGAGASLTITLPKDGCALFGPETPPGDFRPRDPDPTGGYYQPFRLDFEGRSAVALERIVCNLRSAPTDVALDLKARYVVNRNPSITSVEAAVNGVAAPLDDIPRGAAVRFSLRWTEGDDERYVLFDSGTRAVVGARETLRVAWYGTTSTLDPAYDEPAPGETTAQTTWRAPNEPRMTHFWAVVRDSRGGSDFMAWDAVVK